MDRLRAIVAIPAFIVLGIAGRIAEKIRGETDHDYLIRKYPGMYVREWSGDDASTCADVLARLEARARPTHPSA